MNQSALFLLVISLWGLFAIQPMLREMKYAEPVLKIIIAMIIGLAAAFAGFNSISLPSIISILALIIVPVFILTPIVLNALMRGKRYTLVQQLTNLVYWSNTGRKAIKHFLAKIALQRGDSKGALGFLQPQDPLVIRAYALQQQWDHVLAMPVTDSLEVYAARIEAFIAKGNISEADNEFRQLHQLWEKNQTPEGYKLLTLSETRLEAERGQIESVQKKVQTSLSGTPAYLLFGLLARAAETSHHDEPTKNLYTQAYLTAPESQRSIYAAKLKDYGQELPEIQKPKTTYGAFALLATIVLAFLVQLWLEDRYDQTLPGFLAAFLLNFPEIPESTARWRYLSYAFVHGGFAHIAFNAWALFDLGKLYESRRNWANLLAAFVLGTVMGAYFTLIVQGSQQIILVGASGGICGIAGALLADSLRGRSIQDRYLTRSLLQWIVFISIFGLVIPNVSFWGHTGGIIGGLLWGFLRQGLPQHKHIDWFVGGLSIGLIVYTLLSVINLFFSR